eukprot:7331840-Pyramimonas_sp.AAC.1
MRRYAEAKEHNEKYPELRKGKEGQHKLYMRSNCVATTQGISEHEAVTRAARANKGLGSIGHASKRVAKFRASFDYIKEGMDVLAGFALSKEGLLALR